MLTQHENVGKYVGRELDYVSEVLRSDARSATIGGWTQRLERMFAGCFGVRYAIAHNSGTSGLDTCLRAAGIGSGDEVISPALTVIMDTFAILFQNATPVYADISPHTFNIDPEDVRRKITPRTKAIITVSLYGLSADMDPILTIAKENNLIVIEDNAQCLLGMYKGRLAGTIGHMSVFSFENSKHISVGEGGMVITNDDAFAERIRKFGGLGYKNLTPEGGRIKLNEDVFQDPNYKRHDCLGWNYRMAEICAAVAVAQLERVEAIVKMRQDVAQLFAEAIEGCSWLIPQAVPEGYTNTYWSYAVKYEGMAALRVHWQKFRATYVDMGGDGIYGAWSIPYEEPALKKLGYGNGLCPIAEDLQPKLMQFKTNYRDLDQARKKADVLRKVIRHYGR
jgi:perosamine synthetase